MSSHEMYEAWAKENVGATLWIEKGPRNTGIEEIRMIIMGDNGRTAIITIYTDGDGFDVYRLSSGAG